MSTIIDIIIGNRESDSLSIIYVNCDSQVFGLNYRELWSICDSIESQIKPIINGQKNSVIGIYSEVNQIIASLMIAIMKINCLFCYISTEDNSSNNELLFQSLDYIICHENSRKLFQKFISDELTQNKSHKIYKDYTIIKMNNKLSALHYNESFAYLVRSSGTSGRPKHVLVPHSCIIPNIIDLKQEFNVTTVDTILICSPFTFDPSLVDLFIGLSSGSQIVIVDNLIRISPEKLIKVIQKFKVTLMTVTPSFFSRFTLDIIQNVLLSSQTFLKILVFGGEGVSIKLINEYIKFNDNITAIYNIYGVTEVSSWATIYKFDARHCFDDKFNSLPVFGRNLLNTQIVIDDKTNECIIKSDVRKCLVITFNDNQFHNYSKSWTDFYKTGDYCQKTESGFIYITGRSDSIIKLNGRKFDLGSIEAKVENQFIDWINKCVCIANDWHHIKNTVIDVFICLKNEVLFCKKSLILDFLRQKIDKSIAYNVIIVDKFALTPHSKIDRLLLSKEQQNNRRNSYHFCKTYDEIVECICAHFDQYLNVSIANSCKDILDFSLKDFGGESSLLALQIAINVENDFNCDFPSLVDKVLNKNLSEICQYVHQVLNREKNTKLETLEHDSNLKQNFNSHKRRHINSLDDFLIIITRRGVEKIGSREVNFRENNAKLIKLSENQMNKKLKILWSIDLFQCIDSSPLIVERVDAKQTFAFIGSHSGHFVSINLNNGTLNWRIQLNDRIESSAITDTNGENVFIGDYSGHFYSISALNGTINWLFKTGAAIKSSPIFSFELGLVFCGSHDKYLYAWNQLKSEEQLVWKLRISDGSLFSSPILSPNSDLLFAATLDGILAAIRVGSGSIVWKIDLKSALFSSPAIHKEILIIGSTLSSLIAVNTIDGSILWTLNTGKPVFSSPFISSLNNVNQNRVHVFIGTHNNSVLCVDLNSGQIKWQFKTSSAVYSTPFVSSDDNIVIAAETDGILHLINANDGKQLLSHKLNGQLFSSPIIHRSKLFIGCRDNHFYCICLE
jgi:acyl-CoA synthetase